jgi:hypothetical protein
MLKEITGEQDAYEDICILDVLEDSVSSREGARISTMLNMLTDKSIAIFEWPFLTCLIIRRNLSIAEWTTISKGIFCFFLWKVR